jgi:hypothetical protein
MRMNVIRRETVAMLAIIVGLQFCSLQARAQVAAPSESPFDQPVRKVVVDLGPSEFHMPNQNAHSTLSCFYYPHFLVKELDLREKGATWDAIVPVHGGVAPKCEQAMQDGEMRLDQAEWSGYFSGVVGDLVFLDASDGLNGSEAFKVVDAASGRTIFQDEAKRRYRVKNNTLVWEGERLRIERRPNGVPVLTYLRAYRADCALPKDGAECWSKIRAATGLKQLVAPTCTGLFKDHPEDPSVVFYPVRVELGPQPVPAPAPGIVRCEAQE